MFFFESSHTLRFSLPSHGFLQGEADPGHEILEILFQKVILFHSQVIKYLVIYVMS